MVTHQHLTIGKRGRGGCHEFEVACNGFANGAVVEHDLVVEGHVKVSSGC
jgi:hypothetical protein